MVEAAADVGDACYVVHFTAFTTPRDLGLHRS